MILPFLVILLPGALLACGVSSFEIQYYQVKNNYNNRRFNAQFRISRSSFAVAKAAPVERQPPQDMNTRARDDSLEIHGDIEMNDYDDALLKSVKKEQLIELCTQFHLDCMGTKVELLSRLREYGRQQVEQEKSRRESIAKRVEEGYGNDSKERFEIVQDGGDWYTDNGDDDIFIFYDANANNDTAKTSSGDATDAKKESKSKNKYKQAPYLTQAAVTAPPIPPDLQPNEDGERVVTIYSTTEQNDLTGISSVRPDQMANTQDMLQAASGIQKIDRPWEMDAVASTKSRATNEEVEKATETVTGLVQLLLAQSGAPAFRTWLADEDLENSASSYGIPTEFVGFDPAGVPTNQLASASRALRTSRGQVLDDVLRQFEMQAIGQDGISGDKRDKGGGHYREVSKVRAFLEGYRRAEVRKLARETTTLLLDKLVQEGVEGLDLTLASMTRSSDDTSDYAGELNDSLLDFLNDAVRQQEKKVKELAALRLAERRESNPEEFVSKPSEHVIEGQWGSEPIDAIDGLWKVTTEDGERIESIDPNDPAVQEALLQDYNAYRDNPAVPTIPESAPEKMLLLLTLLRDRLRAEAAFAPNGKGRSLRLLAYCLRIPSEREREHLMSRELGSSLDVSNETIHPCGINSSIWMGGPDHIDPVFSSSLYSC